MLSNCTWAMLCHLMSRSETEGGVLLETQHHAPNMAQCTRLRLSSPLWAQFGMTHNNSLQNPDTATPTTSSRSAQNGLIRPNQRFLPPGTSLVLLPAPPRQPPPLGFALQLSCCPSLLGDVSSGASFHFSCILIPIVELK